jgi:hypothetical protein
MLSENSLIAQILRMAFIRIELEPFYVVTTLPSNADAPTPVVDLLHRVLARDGSRRVCD